MKLINLNKTRDFRLRFNRPGLYVVYFENLSENIFFDITGPGVDLRILGLFIGKKNEVFNINTYQNHISPGSKSDILIKGVFYDRSAFNYHGLIRIEKNAQKSHAYMKNQNLVLSKSVSVQSSPYLEILADDVFCTHASATGSINKKELFYILSRGMTKKKAEDILVNGFVNEVKSRLIKLQKS